MIKVIKITREENEAQGQRRFIFHLKAPRTFGFSDNKLILGYPLEFENLNNLGEAVLFSLLPIAFTEASDIALPNELAIEEETLERVSRIYELWNKWFVCERKIKIHAGIVKPSCDSDSSRGGAQLFSGGIDSLSTFQRHRDKLKYLILYQGSDIGISDLKRFQEVIEYVNKIAKSYNKKLIALATNVNYLHPVSWEHVAHGCALVAPTLALSNYIDRVFIASTFSGAGARKMSWGSHPDSDPLVCCSGIEVIHDGFDLKRSEKIIQLCGEKELLKDIRVCCKDIHQQHNCGNCEKCYRTITVLKLQGVSLQEVPFPEGSFSLHRVAAYLSKNKLKSYAKLWWSENLELLEHAPACIDGKDRLIAVLRNSLDGFYSSYKDNFSSGLPKSFEYVSKWRRFENTLGLEPDSLLWLKRLLRRRKVSHG
jgi:hypothetical protein